MAPLRTLSLAVVSGLGFINLNYSADEKFTLLKAQDIEIKLPTFDSLLNESNSFTGPIIKMGLDSFYQQWPQTLEMFLPKDGFLMDLAFQYSGPFFTLYNQNYDLPQKLKEVHDLKSQGISFSTKDLSLISNKEIIEAKKKIVYSYFSHITDEQLQRFYGTIITEAFFIEGVKFDENKEIVQPKIDSLNKGEKIYKINLNKHGGRAFKVKDYVHKSINLMPLLTTPVGKYCLLETINSYGHSINVHKIKKVQLAPMAQVQKHRAAMKTKLIETLGDSLYNSKKQPISKPLNLSSDLPVVKLEIQRHNITTELIEKYLKVGTKNLDAVTANFIKEFIRYCNTQVHLLSVEEIKKDRNGIRVLALVNSIGYEILGPVFSYTERSKNFFNVERIRCLEVLKEVQHPASMHLLLAQLYQQTNNPKAIEAVEEYLKKDGLSHVSYLPLTKQLVEERTLKVQKVIDQLKDMPEDKIKELKVVLEMSKTKALQKSNS